MACSETGPAGPCSVMSLTGHGILMDWLGQWCSINRSEG